MWITKKLRHRFEKNVNSKFYIQNEIFETARKMGVSLKPKL